MPTATDTLHTFHLPAVEVTLAAAAAKPTVVTGPTLDELDEAADAMAALVAKYVGRVAGHAARQLGGVIVADALWAFGGLTAQTPPPPTPRQAAVSADDIGVITDQWAVVVSTVLAPAVASDYLAAAQAQAARIQAIVRDANLTEEQLAQFTLPLIDLQEAAQAAAAEAVNRLRGIGDELWGHARTSLTEGMAAGESVPKLAERVRQATGVALPRATVIARTESMTARSAGAYDEMTTVAQLGIVDSKTWLATHDGRTRPTHVAADGQTVPFDAKFTVGGWPADHPHDPFLPAEESANCRCSLIWNLSGEEPVYPLVSTLPVSALWTFEAPGQARDSHGRWTDGGGSGDVQTGQAALDAAPAKLTAGPGGHHGHYEGELLSGPEGMGSVRALSEYEGVEYGRTNSYLRHPEDMTRAFKDHPEEIANIKKRVGEMDQTMKASRLQRPVEVERMVQRGAPVFGEETWYGPDITSRDLDRQDRAWERWQAGERPSLTGLKWREKGYVSTTADPTITSHYANRYKRANSEGEGEPVLLKIRVPAGTGAIQMSPMNNGKSGEGELLLDRGLVMHVTADKGVIDGLRVLEVDVVPE